MIGNGGHVVFEATYVVNNLAHLKSLNKAEDGQNGRKKDCHGKNGEHKIIKVPVGTIIRNPSGKVIGDLDKEGAMFIAARGGAGEEFVSKLPASPIIIFYISRVALTNYMIFLLDGGRWQGQSFLFFKQ